MEDIVKAVWGPTAIHAKGLMSSHVPCHNPDADFQHYDPDLARQALMWSSYGSADNLPPLMIDRSRANRVDTRRLFRAYWKDDLGLDLEVFERNYPLGQRNLGFVSGVDLEVYELDRKLRHKEYIHFHHIIVESWSPDPSQIVSSLSPSGFLYYTWPNAGLSFPPLILRMFEHAMSLPLDHPNRCAAFQAYEEEYLNKVDVIPIREIDPVRWVVQPWLRGFKSTFNQDFNTLTSAYVVRH